MSGILFFIFASCHPLTCGFDMTKFAQCQSETCFRMAHFQNGTQYQSGACFRMTHFQNGTQHVHMNARFVFCFVFVFCLFVCLFCFVFSFTRISYGSNQGSLPSLVPSCENKITAYSVNKNSCKNKDFGVFF